MDAFREFGTGERKAVATPGYILLQIRAEHLDLCFELAALVVKRLGQAVTGVDEVQGFRCFDMRSIIGFVDGTENPGPREVARFTLVGDEDPQFSGGSYVLVQKYLHDMNGWEALSTVQQEHITGRTKLSDIELDAPVKPSCSHSSLTTLEEGGQETKILRDNMPFGRPGPASSAHISSDMPVRRRRSSKCWKTCSSASHQAITTACWTTAGQ